VEENHCNHWGTDEGGDAVDGEGTLEAGHTGDEVAYQCKDCTAESGGRHERLEDDVVMELIYETLRNIS
jgi:hypothetical protein